MSDVWSSAGLRLPRQLSFDTGIELPCGESYFLNMSPDMEVIGNRVANTGIWGEMARLCCIWSEIQDLNRAAVEDGLPPMTLAPRIGDIARKLEAWKDDLPEDLKETRHNLEQATALGLGHSFAALHLGFHYYHEVLFYRYVAESQQSPTPVANLYASECIEHARAFCDLLYLCEGIPGCVCMFAMVGHMLVITSTVYVHMLLFENGHEDLGKVRSRLEHNFEILTELRKHWATLDMSLARLRAFHNACLYSIEHSFSMDRWMLSFILQHGTSIPDRFPESGDSIPQMATQGHESYLGYLGEI